KMNEAEKENLFITFQQTIKSIINDKKKNPKNQKKLEKFNAKINIGLQIEEDSYHWVNLLAENGNYSLNRGKLEEYDLELMATPEDLLFFSNGENSTFNMLMKKNSYGYRKLRFLKSSGGKRNLGMLLKLSKLLVLD
ncbi:MAG: hypothetical protein ACFFBI_08840, partial [Promethearchaeota archaeon]